MTNTVYIPQSSSSLLVNIIDNTVNTIEHCLIKCLNHERCQTVVYYYETSVCSLFCEKSSVGQIVNQTNGLSSVISMTNRQPNNNIILTWSINYTILIGNSAGSSGTTLSELSSPTGMCYDQSRREIIIGDRANYRIIKFSLDNLSANGTILAGGNNAGCSNNKFLRIEGVALDSSRQLYVTDLDCKRVMKFPADSNSATSGQIIALMNQPQAITIDRQTDDVYVADSGDRLIMKFTNSNPTDGVVVAGGHGWGTNLNQLTNIFGIYFDSINTNALYVSDCYNHRILKFPANSTNATFGTLIAGNGISGSGSNQISNAQGVTIDMNGVLYIADTGNRRIQRWLPDGNSGDTLSTDQSIEAQQILLDKNNNLIVLETTYNRLRLYSIATC